MAGAIPMLFRAMVRTAVGLAVLLSTAAAQDVGSAQITGRVVDAQGAPLPGAQITATQDSVRKETVTGNDGGFAISGLAPGTYDVRADLAGFETVSIRVPVAATGAGNPLTIRMWIGCFEPDLEVVSPLDHVVQAADLIVRVQIDSIEQAYQPRVGEGYCGPITVFEATIRELVVNRRPQRLGPLRFVMPGSRAPFFSSGGDYVAFLGWHSGTSTYRTFWRSYLLPVREGKVNLPGRDLGEGDQPLDKVLAAVRALAGRR